MVSDERKRWQDQGYLILRGAVDAEQLRQLYSYCEAALASWRGCTADGEPGGFADGPSAWIQLHLNHPRYGRLDSDGRAALLNAVATPQVQGLLREIMGEDAVMLQANYYIDPPGHTRVGNWHRDAQFFHPNDEEGEKQAVADEAEPPRTLHMHIPLVPTRATEVVPGSHDRWDTPEENRIRRQDATSDDMPGRLVIELEPGDLAFFHTNSLHRGQYIQGVPRRTIAVTYGLPSRPQLATAASMAKSRGYVATYQPWCLRPGYLDGCTAKARSFHQRFIDVYRESWQESYLAELSPQLQAYFTEG